MEEEVRQLMREVERIKTSKDGPSESTKNRVVAFLAVELGDLEKAKRALGIGNPGDLFWHLLALRDRVCPTAVGLA